MELTKRKEKKWNGCRLHFPARRTWFPARLQRFPAWWLPTEVLRSQNKYRGFDADIMGKKKIILVFQMEVCGGRKVREKVKIDILKFHQSRKQMGAFWRGRREGCNGGCGRVKWRWMRTRWSRECRRFSWRKGVCVLVVTERKKKEKAFKWYLLSPNNNKINK